jgi:hypothetical protein
VEFALMRGRRPSIVSGLESNLRKGAPFLAVESRRRLVGDCSERMEMTWIALFSEARLRNRTQFETWGFIILCDGDDLLGKCATALGSRIGHTRQRTIGGHLGI